MIKIVTNSKGSGDWIKILDNDDLLWEGHTVSVYDLKFILSTVTANEVQVVEIDDNQMEEGYWP